MDQDFAICNFKVAKWQDTIDKFYDKYKTLAKWHTELVQEVTRTGFLKMPTGREYHFVPKKNYRGELEWPRTTILNYPVQGLGADIMSIARVIFYHKFIKHKIEGVIFNTVHDSIEVDVPSYEKDKVVELFYQTFKEIPKVFKDLFGIEYNLPLFCEVSYGPNRKDLTEIK